MTTPDVPQTLHELLRLALDDFDIVTQQPDVKVEMGLWKRTSQDNVCHLCLAGAVMRNTFNIAQDVDGLSLDAFFTQPWVWAFTAIDHMRMGYVENALLFLKYDKITFDEKCKARKLDFDPTSYYRNPAKWRTEMEKLYLDLKADNL